MYIDDLLQSYIKSPIYGYADDTKLFCVSNSLANCEDLQVSLNQVVQWSLDCQLALAIEKCGVLYLGHNNKKFHYSIDGINIHPFVSHCDLGVTFDNLLKYNNHYSQMVQKAHRIANLILKCFTCKVLSVLVKAFVTYARPLLEFSSEVWCPYLKTDIRIIESVQRRFTKRLPGLYGLSYQERLNVLKLESLELRRVKIDLRCCFKVLNEISFSGPLPPLLRLCKDRHARGHSKKLTWPTPRLNCRHNHFILRVGRVWNELPESVVMASTVQNFNRKMQKLTFEDYLDLEFY